MVECGGLENRCTCKRTEGSNPSLSAISEFFYIHHRQMAALGEQAYQRSSLVGKRSAMMIDWARFITRCEQ